MNDGEDSLPYEMNDEEKSLLYDCMQNLNKRYWYNPEAAKLVVNFKRVYKEDSPKVQSIRQAFYECFRDSTNQSSILSDLKSLEDPVNRLEASLDSQGDPVSKAMDVIPVVLCDQLARLVCNAEEKRLAWQKTSNSAIHSYFNRLSESAKEAGKLFEESSDEIKEIYGHSTYDENRKHFSLLSDGEFQELDAPDLEFKELAARLTVLGSLCERLAKEYEVRSKKPGRPENSGNTLIGIKIGRLLKAHNYRLSTTPNDIYVRVLEKAFEFISITEKPNSKKLASKCIKEINRGPNQI